jgi:hypothetical protein
VGKFTRTPAHQIRDRSRKEIHAEAIASGLRHRRMSEELEDLRERVADIEALLNIVSGPATIHETSDI